MKTKVNPIQTANLGYPRIGENREWKRALERFWSGQITEEDWRKQLETIRLHHWKKQMDKGIDYIPVNDFSRYDQMLDTAAMFSLVPKRFEHAGGVVPPSVYYAMARGSSRATACEMTKWFNTNYHYIVPELDDTEPNLVENRPLAAYREAKAKLGMEGRPVLIGPYTFVKLSKGYRPDSLVRNVAKLVPLYSRIMVELAEEGVRWVQMDEPALVQSVSSEEMKCVEAVYETLHEAAPDLNIMLQTYFDAVEQIERVLALPVRGIGLDFVHDGGRHLRWIEENGFPQNKVLGAGIVDGRNVWRSDYAQKLALIGRLLDQVKPEQLVLQPSCSLLHVPVSVKGESKLEPVLYDALAFADEKLDELATLAEAAAGGTVADELERNRIALERLRQSPMRNRNGAKSDANERKWCEQRQNPYAERRKVQKRKWQLPPFPTTTIGSFPQTAEVRRARRKYKSGEWNEEQYLGFIREQIAKWVEYQEQIGLDVFVHGEFERNDMVEFFGEKMPGFAFTQNGWVQSYGSRCVKPPILYGDVEYAGPMTVEVTVYAQSLTDKPVKGMLTGPVTMLNWSFVRDDMPRYEVADQIALALREEVLALEAAGIGMIQVDEPALREGLPLKREEWSDYLQHAVRAFRLVTASVKDETQIHTHMCYSDFHDIMEAIRDLDADVISIETSRSHGELIDSFEQQTYDKEIGLGVYDIHSPRVPTVEEMTAFIERSLRSLKPELFWINPDCGLKTRGEEETVAALKNMVQAARIVRDKLRKSL